MQTLDCKAHNCEMDFRVLGNEYEPRLVIVVKWTKSDPKLCLNKMCSQPEEWKSQPPEHGPYQSGP